METGLIKILAIDGNQDNLIRLKALIREAFPDARVFTATNGKSGLKIADAENPDVILLDIVMPDIDGFEVCKTLKADQALKDIPVVFVTALKGDCESRIKALEAGGGGFLSKPVDESELKAQIRAMLKISEAARLKRDEKEKLHWLVEKRTKELLKSEAQYAFLTNSAFELVKLTSMQKIYEFTARKLHELLEGNGIVSIVEYITETNRWKMQHIIGVNNRLSELGNIFGFDIRRLEGDISTKYYDIVTSGKLVEVEYDFPALFNNRLSHKIGDAVKNLLSVDKMYCMAFQQHKKAFGNITIATNKKTKPLNVELIEAFVLQVSNFVKRQKTEESLKQSEEKMRGIYRVAPAGIGVIADRVMKEVNPRVCEMTGYTREELIEKNARILYPSQEEFELVGKKKYDQIREKGTGKIETQWQKKDGTIINVLLASTPIDIEDFSKGVIFTALDITERMQAEEALRESEQRLKLALAATRQGIYDLNLKTGDTAVSPEYAAMLGYDPENFKETNDGWIERLHPDDKQRVEGNYRDYIAGKLPEYRVEFRQLTKEGKWKWILSLGSIVEHDHDGNPVRMLGTHFDITDRKLIEGRLKDSEETYRNLFQNAQVGLFRTRISDGKVLESNDQLARMFGFKNREDFIGNYKTSANYVDEGTRERMLSILKTHGFIQNFEARFYRKDRKIFYANYSAIVFADKGWIEGVAEDITERKKMELALQESESKFRTLFETANDAIFLMDKEIFTDCNPRTLEMFGCKKEQIVGQSPHKFSPELQPDGSRSDKSALEMITACLSGSMQSFEWKHKRLDGTLFDAEISLNPFRMKNKTYIQAIVRDITDRKLAEQELRNREELLRDVGKVASIGGWEFDAATGEGSWTDEVASIHDLDPEKVTNRDYGLQFYESESRKIIQAAIHDAIHHGKPYNLELELISAKGTHKWVQTIGRPVFENGKVVKVRGSLQDISERKKTEALVAESELRHRSLIEQMQEGLLMVDNDDVIQFVNPKFCEMLGYKASELLGKVGYKLIIKETQWDAIIKKNRERQKGISEQYEFSMIKKTGEEIIVLMNAAPINDKDGNVNGSMATCVDITERKKTEAELRDSEERFRALHNASFGGIVIHDKGKIIGCNQGLVEMTGYSMDELVGMDGLKLISKKALDTVLKNINAGYEQPYESVCVRKDGVEFPIRIESRNIPYKGKMVRVTEFRDISEEKRIEQIRTIQYVIAKAILNAESFEKLLLTIRSELGQVMDATNFIVATYNSENDTLKKVVFEDEKDDYSEWSAKNTFSGYVVKKGEKLLFTKETEAEIAEKNNIQLTGSAAECWLGVPIDAGNKPAGVIVLQSYSDPCAYDSGSVALLELVAHEIGLFLERRKMLTDLVEAKNQAEAGDRLKTAFMNNISHEIRTPLNGILGFGRMLAQSNVSEPERLAYLDILEKSSARLISTISDYMDISLIASGNLKIYPEPFVVVHLLNDLFEKLKSESANKNLATEMLLHNTPETLQLNTDRELVNKALLHLINNAIKFTPAGKIILGCKCYRDAIEFYVKDTGIGVSEEAKQRIFQNFGQEEVTPTREYEGSGLGLSIAAGIVKLFNGEIRMETRKDVGSVFSISLPLTTDETVEQLATDEAENLIAEIPKPLVLIAEDEESNAMYLKVILEKASCDVIYVANGRDAVEQCRLQPDICLVFMDMKMPVLNGVEATKQIKALQSDLPVIAITAHALTGDEHYFRSAGCDDYLAKPVLREVIIEKLKKYSVI